MRKVTLISVFILLGILALFASTISYAETADAKPDETTVVRELLLKRITLTADFNRTGAALSGTEKESEPVSVRKDTSIYSIKLRYAISPSVIFHNFGLDTVDEKIRNNWRERNFLNAFTIYLEGSLGNELVDSTNIEDRKDEWNKNYTVGVNFTACFDSFKTGTYNGGCSPYK